MSKQTVTAADVIGELDEVASGPAPPIPKALTRRGWHDCLETTTIVEQDAGRRTFLASLSGQAGRYTVLVILDVRADCARYESLLYPVEVSE